MVKRSLLAVLAVLVVLVLMATSALADPKPTGPIDPEPDGIISTEHM